MPLLTAAPSSGSNSHAPTQRRRCWTVCEARNSHNQKAELSVKPGAATAIVGRCRTNSLRISIGQGGGDQDQDLDDFEFCKSNQLVLSPCSSPSFSFDSVCDMFAAMDSPRVNMRMHSPLSNAHHLPLDDGHSAADTRVQVLSPTTKRPRTNKSDAASRASSRVSRRYTSILSRCLPKQMKSSFTSNRDYPHYHEMTAESPRDHHQSYRVTDCATTTNLLVASTTSCSVLTSSSPARKRFGTVLLNDDHHDLQHLFRDEAEYSDYLSVIVTGSHSQMDAVVFYEVEVHLSQMQWKLYRRFSEFRALRQDLIKHFSKRLRQQQQNSNNGNSCSSSSKCEICAHMLDAIEQHAFPSRQQTHRHWHKLFKSASSSSSSNSSSSSSLESDSTNGGLKTDAFSAEAVIADRKAKFGEFVAICLRTMRGLRQHGKVMEDSSACEIGMALRMIEEFFGLSFTRYLRFLSERGVVGGGENSSSKGTQQLSFMSGPTNRRRLTTVA